MEQQRRGVHQHRALNPLGAQMQVPNRAFIGEIDLRESMCAFFQDLGIIPKRQVLKLLAGHFQKTGTLRG